RCGPDDHRRHLTAITGPENSRGREERSNPMKSLWRALAGSVVAIGLALAATAAGAAESKGKIVYLVPTLLDEFQTGSIDAITKFMKDVGYEVVALDGQNQT